MLGLVLETQGKRSSAIKEFSEVLVLNPGNKEVEQILKNLNEGKEALAGIATSPDSEFEETQLEVDSVDSQIQE